MWLVDLIWALGTDGLGLLGPDSGVHRSGSGGWSPTGHLRLKDSLGSWPANGGLIGRNKPVRSARCQVLWESWLNGLYLYTSESTKDQMILIKTELNWKLMLHTILLTLQKKKPWRRFCLWFLCCCAPHFMHNNTLSRSDDCQLTIFQGFSDEHHFKNDPSNTCSDFLSDIS